MTKKYITHFIIIYIQKSTLNATLHSSPHNEAYKKSTNRIKIQQWYMLPCFIHNPIMAQFVLKIDNQVLHAFICLLKNHLNKCHNI